MKGELILSNEDVLEILDKVIRYHFGKSNNTSYADIEAAAYRGLSSSLRRFKKNNINDPQMQRKDIYLSSKSYILKEVQRTIRYNTRNLSLQYGPEDKWHTTQEYLSKYMINPSDFHSDLAQLDISVLYKEASLNDNQIQSLKTITHGFTLKEMGDKLNMTGERVRQHRQKALQKLRDFVEESNG